MLVAVVQRAILDFFLVDAHPMIAWEAGKWLFSDSHRVMSLWWICEWLADDNAEGLRDRILADVKAGKKPTKAVAIRVDR